MKKYYILLLLPLLFLAGCGEVKDTTDYSITNYELPNDGVLIYDEEHPPTFYPFFDYEECDFSFEKATIEDIGEVYPPEVQKPKPLSYDYSDMRNWEIYSDWVDKLNKETSVIASIEQKIMEKDGESCLEINDAICCEIYFNQLRWYDKQKDDESYRNWFIE